MISWRYNGSYSSCLSRGFSMAISAPIFRNLTNPSASPPLLQAAVCSQLEQNVACCCKVGFSGPPPTNLLKLPTLCFNRIQTWVCELFPAFSTSHQTRGSIRNDLATRQRDQYNQPFTKVSELAISRYESLSGLLSRSRSPSTPSVRKLNSQTRRNPFNIRYGCIAVHQGQFASCSGA